MVEAPVALLGRGAHRHVRMRLRRQVGTRPRLFGAMNGVAGFRRACEECIDATINIGISEGPAQQRLEHSFLGISRQNEHTHRGSSAGTFLRTIRYGELYARRCPNGRIGIAQRRLDTLECSSGRPVRVTNDTDALHGPEIGRPCKRLKRLAQSILAIKDLHLNIRKFQAPVERFEEIALVLALDEELHLTLDFLGRHVQRISRLWRITPLVAVGTQRHATDGPVDSLQPMQSKPLRPESLVRRLNAFEAVSRREHLDVELLGHILDYPPDVRQNRMMQAVLDFIYQYDATGRRHGRQDDTSEVGHARSHHRQRN